MAYSTSIAELKRAGVVFRPSEAVAIAQKLISATDYGSPQPPFGPPSMENVVVDDQGAVTCSTCAVKPAVSEIAILLEAMLPSGAPLPGALRYTVARALLNVDAPPFDSIEELSSALARFERSERDAVIRDLVERARAAAGGAPAAVIPFKPSPSPVRSRPERRRPMPAAVAADLRRDLRRADLERYAQQAANPIPDLRRTPGHQKRPIGAVMAGLGAGLVLIVSGEMMHMGPRPAPESTILAVPGPPRHLPAPAASLPLDRAIGSSGSAPSAMAVAPRTASRPVTVQRVRRAQVDRVETRSTSRAPEGVHPGRGDRRSSGSGVLARFRLQWIRHLFTYRDDL